MSDKKYAEKMVEKYTEKDVAVSKVEELRRLDHKAKRPALVFAYTFGVIGSLVLGFGMSVAMGVILSGLMALGIVVGVVGLIMCLVNYPIYKKLLASRRARYADEIIAMSDEIINA